MPATCRLDPDRIRRRLTTTGRTQTALAHALGIELRTLQRWVAGGTLRLEDAERIACELGVGTAEIADSVPDEPSSTFAVLRSALTLLRRSDGPMVHAVRATLEHFGFIDAYLSFDAHPRRGFVRRIRLPEAEAHRFHVLRLMPSVAGEATYRFAAQVGRRFRYEFGEVRAGRAEASLVEHFHTRSVRCDLRADGSFDVHVWVPREMHELVVCGDADFALTPVPTPPSNRFCLDRPETRHAVCFRPSAMHLRQAGLSGTFDRIDGPRGMRVDGKLELE